MKKLQDLQQGDRFFLNNLLCEVGRRNGAGVEVYFGLPPAEGEFHFTPDRATMPDYLEVELVDDMISRVIGGERWKPSTVTDREINAGEMDIREHQRIAAWVADHQEREDARVEFNWLLHTQTKSNKTDNNE